MDPLQYPHRRKNSLTGEWVLVSPHRTLRPWHGQVEKAAGEKREAYDPGCYLCPGNARAAGHRNPLYASTHVFTNDFSAILPGGPVSLESSHPLLELERETGECRVICFSPRHDVTLAEMPEPEIRAVVDVWAREVDELGRSWRWVQVFENRGAVMGCSNPHPHGQIWCGSALPNEPAKEDAAQRGWFQRTGSPLLVDYARLESDAAERTVVGNDRWIAVVPWWALWPFETLIVPLRHVTRITDLNVIERNALAALLKQLLTRYDNLFEVSFPYSMGWHGAPTGPESAGEDASHWQLHAHVFPPLLRSATVKKFMVGYEMLAEPQRDLTPEQAAARLRGLPGVHFRSHGR